MSQSVSEIELAPVAAVITSLLQLLKGPASPAAHRWAQTSLAHACRHVEYFLVPRVSEAAHAKAVALGIAPLERYRWADQRSRMKDPGRKVFHWEHMVPVSDLQAELRKLQTPDLPSVGAVLSKAQVAWILKSENERLDKAKLRYGRANGGLAAYKQVGIRLRRR